MELTVALNTNAYSDWRSKETWHNHIRLADRILMPAMVMGELFHGFRKGGRYEANRK